MHARNVVARDVIISSFLENARGNPLGLIRRGWRAKKCRRGRNNVRNNILFFDIIARSLYCYRSRPEHLLSAPVPYSNNNIIAYVCSDFSFRTKPKTDQRARTVFLESHANLVPFRFSARPSVDKTYLCIYWIVRFMTFRT